MSAATVRTLALSAVTRTGETLPVPPRVDPQEYRRFAAAVAVVPGVDGCHLWTGQIFRGYGRFPVYEYLPAEKATRTTITGAHRYSFRAHHGPEPEERALEALRQARAAEREAARRAQQLTLLPGYTDDTGPDDEDAGLRIDVRHTCDETLCVNAEHLVLGDAWDNAHDRNSRGRAGSHRHGVRRHGADTRDRAARAKALRAVVRANLATPHLLPAAVERIRAEGDPQAGQIALIPSPAPRLRLVTPA